MTLRLLGLGILLILGLPACSSSSPKATAVDAGPPAPTFANVYDLVLKARSCNQIQCHGAIAAGGLDLSSKSAAYTNLVGVAAAGPCVKPAAGDSGAGDSGAAGAPGIVLPTPVCGCGLTGKTRVVAKDPTSSLLVEKVVGEPTCGERMPQTGEPLTTELVTLIEQWITLGAKND